MAYTFTFPYSEYYVACNKLFATPPAFKHLFRLWIESNNFAASLFNSTTQVSGAQTSGLATDLSFFCSGVKTPKLTMGAITRTFQGVPMKLPALSDYGDKTVTLTIYDTQDRFLYNAIRTWQDTIVDSDFSSATVGQMNLTGIELQDRLIIQALTTNGVTAPSWCMYGIFPIAITDVTGLNQDEIGDILTFEVEFKYRYVGYGQVAIPQASV